MTLLRSEHVIEVECDHAKHPASRMRRITGRGSDERKALQALVDAGWTWDGRLYWCPICRERDSEA